MTTNKKQKLYIKSTPQTRNSYTYHTNNNVNGVKDNNNRDGNRKMSGGQNHYHKHYHNMGKATPPGIWSLSPLDE